MSALRVAVLAVQGAFVEHEAVLQGLGCETFQLRQRADALKPFDALVLPGGESTVQAKLLHELDMFDPLHRAIGEGMPVLGTCAGLILLAQDVREEGRPSPVRGFGMLPVAVERNAYGRQLGSFQAEGQARAGMPDRDDPVPLRFIRAPRITSVGEGVEVLVSLEGHPELTADARIHERLLELIP